MQGELVAKQDRGSFETVADCGADAVTRAGAWMKEHKGEILAGTAEIRMPVARVVLRQHGKRAAARVQDGAAYGKYSNARSKE